MKTFGLKKMYLPTLSILLAVLFMLALIGVSTYRNLDRARRKTMAALHRQGVSLLHCLEAGARVGLMSGLGERALEGIVRETAKSDDIAYIYITDKAGVVRFASSPALVGKPAPWQARPDPGGAVESRVRQISPGERIYELAERFLPGVVPARSLSAGPAAGKTSANRPQIIVLGLKMIEFERADAADMHHAVFMSAILVALGSAAFFFLFVIQNYYLVDKALRQAQDYTRQVVAHMANGLLSIDSRGQVVSFNRLAIELLDVEEADIGGRDLRQWIDFDATGISQTLSRCQAVMDREMIYQRKNGRTLPLSLSVTPISGDSNTCTGAVILLRDLREIKQLEAQVRRAEKLAAIGELAAGVAHEIRNPLSSIKGFAQYLRHSLKDRPEECEYAQVMAREVDRINRVVTDLLTYARPMRVDLLPVDLPELVHHTLRLGAADAQAKEVSLTPRLSNGLGTVKLDGNQITQALLNLLLNSIHAVSRRGKIEVGGGMEKGGRLLRLWVEDDGPGIAAEHQEKVLDPFFTTRHKGTGLGLAIVQKIAENHRGWVQIQSPPAGRSGGTLVSIFIPVETGDEAS
jgi:two-component system sensor histidine kinase HydH